MAESPQQTAKTIIDVNHPEAGKGGVVPPAHSRFRPGECHNPGGRPRGYSVLHEIMRELAAGAEISEDGTVIRSGARARELAQALMDVAAGRRSPNDIDVKAALAIMDRTDGPVEKRIEHSGEITTKRIVLDRGAP